MAFSGTTYLAGDTVIHRCDPRVKIALLLALSIAAFLVKTWWGMAAFAAATLALLAAAKLPAAAVNRMLAPVYVLAAFSIAFNVGSDPTWNGVSTGLFLTVRMIAVVALSFAVCLTTPASDLLDGFAWFLEPLRHLRVPVDDVSFTLMLAIRFIPVIEGEFQAVRRAQRARGADRARSFTQRLRMWGAAFSAVFVGLFRHADALATAMDARCYGAAPKRTRLPKQVPTANEPQPASQHLPQSK